MERLDRAYVDHEWLMEYPEGTLINEPITVSDHAAITYDSNPNLGKRIGRIKLIDGAFTSHKSNKIL